MPKITDMMQKIDYVENPYYNKKYGGTGSKRTCRWQYSGCD